ncbi:Ig-like domain-containing protein [Ekhidna sp.]|uniref:NHL domain-containing protein n=1 Tax=Ekhidna sp. TaxID=2608089 RepID=UPI003512EBF9
MKALVKTLSFSLFLSMTSVSFCQPNEIIDVDVPHGGGGFGQSGDIWQSFKSTQAAPLVKIKFYKVANKIESTRIFRLYEGEGTGGTLLLETNTEVLTTENGYGTVAIPRLNLTPGESYTFWIENINPGTGNSYEDGHLLAYYNGTPYSQFDMAFQIILDVGTNSEIRSDYTLTSKTSIPFNVILYGNSSGLEISDFIVTNGTATELINNGDDSYVLMISPENEGDVIVELPAGVATVNSGTNERAIGSVEYTHVPTIQDEVLTDDLFAEPGDPLLQDNSFVDSYTYIAPEGTTIFTPGATITQGVDGPNSYINAPSELGTYKLYLRNSEGEFSEPSERNIYVLDNRDKPIFNSYPATTINEDELYTYNISTESRLHELGFDITASDLPEWLTLNSQNTISTKAGTTWGYSGDGGPATEASLSGPSYLHHAKDGSLYIVDISPSVIRKIDTEGIITTFAGNGEMGFSGDGGPAHLAALNEPTSLVFDEGGVCYFTDTQNHRIRKIDTDGTISTIAGDGTNASTGDGGLAINASLSRPQHLVIDSNGNLYFNDGSYWIRKIDTEGIITTYAGDGQGDYFYVEGENAIDASFLGGPMAIDQENSIYISCSSADRIRKIDGSTTIMTTIAGTGVEGFTGDGGLATNATLNYPRDLVIDDNGSIFFVDYNNRRIRVIRNDGTIETIAGNGAFGFSEDGSDALTASFKGLAGIALNEEGTLFVSERQSSKVRAIQTNRAILTGTPTNDDVGTTSFSISVSNNQGTSTQPITLEVINVNDAPHAIHLSNNEIYENQPIGTEIGILSTDDVDLNDSHSYSISGVDAVAFQLGPNGNELQSAESFDFESKPSYSITITTSDGADSFSQDFIINVENIPEITTVTGISGYYKTSDDIQIQVEFDANVTLIGSGALPSLSLETGSVDGTASFISGADGESGMTFSYTVKDGDVSSDLDYSIASIIMGDYTLTSTEGVNAILDLPDPGTIGSLSATSDIVLDTEAPTLSYVNINSNNMTTSVAKAGDVVQVTFEPSESLQNMEVTIAGRAATIVEAEPGEFTASVTMEVSDTEGDIPFTINYTDLAGNAGTEVTTSTNSTSVTFDNSAPQIEFSASVPTNTAVLVAITFDEVVTGLSLESFSVTNGSASDLSGDADEYTVLITPVNEGTVTVEVNERTAWDAAGNSNAVASFSFEYDITAPTATITTEASSIVTEAFEISIDFSETVKSFEIDDINVINGAASGFSGEGTSFSATITPMAEGDVSVSLAQNITRDLAGNPNTASETLTVKYEEPLGFDVHNMIIAYPNPVSSVLSIESDQSFSWKLLDTAGKVITEGATKEKQTRLDVTNIRQGIYLMKITTSSGSAVKRVSIKH